ncbi:hypothetical protein ACFSBZ_00175 [Amnibacterium flavum]|nr:hypothetical protein [Amnibacterium flavum]
MTIQQLPHSPGQSEPDKNASARRAVLDDLNLAMLFIDSGRIEHEADLVVDGEQADTGSRHLRVRITAYERLTPATTAALLCRILHNLRIPGVTIDRVPGGVRMRCRYLLPTGAWNLEIFAPLS